MFLFPAEVYGVLPNILGARIHLENTQNIFFVVTSPSVENGEVFINPRQACSIESAASVNPTHLICVIIVDNMKLKSSQIIASLNKYSNVAFYRLKLSEFSHKTPVEAWLKSKKLYDTKFLSENVSDLLRLLLLWR